ncbi:uncharacterized protein [Patagioenas fasciata]|uniref:uncharacterized protein isoform X5 n=2 Tax=Patagioenas fasciata TaxID=372321 RepID=UPI0032E8EED5
MPLAAPASGWRGSSGSVAGEGTGEHVPCVDGGCCCWSQRGWGEEKRKKCGAVGPTSASCGGLRTAERPELPERKGGEKETGASELLEASWQPPKARAAAVSQPEDPLCPAAGPVEPRTLLAHPGDVSGAGGHCINWTRKESLCAKRGAAPGRRRTCEEE